MLDKQTEVIRTLSTGSKLQDVLMQQIGKVRKSQHPRCLKSCSQYVTYFFVCKQKVWVVKEIFPNWLN